MKTWFEKLGGRKFTALLIGVILVLLMVTLATCVILVLSKNMERLKIAVGFAEVMGLEALGGIIAYITGNVYQKKTANNGGADAKPK